MIASCGHLEEKLQECSKEEGVTMAESVEKGAKEKASRRNCKVRFSFMKNKKAFRRVT